MVPIMASNMSKYTTSFAVLIQLAKSKEAIVISPDYCLLPEAKGTEMLDDVKDF
jgi:hypothetical protein